jgi:hypothetical protein
MHTFLGAVAQIDRHLASVLGFPEQRGGAVLFNREVSIPPRKAIKTLPCIPLFLLVCVNPGFSYPQPGK